MQWWLPRYIMGVLRSAAVCNSDITVQYEDSSRLWLGIGNQSDAIIIILHSLTLRLSIYIYMYTYVKYTRTKLFEFLCNLLSYIFYLVVGFLGIIKKICVGELKITFIIMDYKFIVIRFRQICLMNNLFIMNCAIMVLVYFLTLSFLIIIINNHQQ